MRRNSIFIVGIFSFLLVSCLTINVYFPAAAVEQAANKFVEDVQGEAKEPKEEKDEQSWFFPTFQWVSVANAAGEDAIQIDTPEANRIKSAMKSRYGEIAKFKSQGVLGENKEGFLEVKDIGNIPLVERAQAQEVLQAENKDREKLYAEIVRANDYKPDKQMEVQKIFAKSWQNNAQSGWWVQAEDGNWVKK